MSFSDVGSLTTRLSKGERPVLLPEYAVRAPVDDMAEPGSYTNASSYSAGTDGLGIFPRDAPVSLSSFLTATAKTGLRTKFGRSCAEAKNDRLVGSFNSQ